MGPAQPPLLLPAPRSPWPLPLPPRFSLWSWTSSGLAPLLLLTLTSPRWLAAGKLPPLLGCATSTRRPCPAQPRTPASPGLSPQPLLPPLPISLPRNLLSMAPQDSCLPPNTQLARIRSLVAPPVPRTDAAATEMGAQTTNLLDTAVKVNTEKFTWAVAAASTDALA